MTTPREPLLPSAIEWHARARRARELERARDESGSSSAERTRRYRARLRTGVILVPVPVGLDEIAFLLDLEWLPLVESEDRRAIGASIGRLLTASAAGHKRER
jgi:hypothetical protein